MTVPADATAHGVDDYRWPSADVLWQSVFDADDEWGIPHGVHVFVMRDVESLQRASQSPTAGAWSLSYDEPDDQNVRGLILLAPPVELSAVIHEVTHVALHWASFEPNAHDRARRWLRDHPESVPILTGNLSTVVWVNLPREVSNAA